MEKYITNLKMLEEDFGEDLLEAHGPEERVDEDDPAVLWVDEQVAEVDLVHEPDEGVVELVVGGGRPPPGVELARRGDDGAGRGLPRVAHLNQISTAQVETGTWGANVKGSYLGVGGSNVDNDGIFLGDEADALVKWHFIRISSPLHSSHRFASVENL